jgi:hypothetical protein
MPEVNGKLLSPLKLKITSMGAVEASARWNGILPVLSSVLLVAMAWSDYGRLAIVESGEYFQLYRARQMAKEKGLRQEGIDRRNES